MPGHDSSYNSFQCFCGGIGGSVSTVPLNFRTEWLGGAGMGLPYQCAQCLEKVLPAATSAASDVAAITVNYCYLPPRSPTVPDFGPIHQLMGFAENSTFTNKREYIQVICYPTFLIFDHGFNSEREEKHCSPKL